MRISEISNKKVPLESLFKRKVQVMSPLAKDDEDGPGDGNDRGKI